MAVSENDLVVGPLVPAAGVTTISLDFYFEQAAWLEVYKSGSETPLVLNTDYTVTGAGSSSGVVTLATAANGADSYSVYLVVPLQRSSDMQLRGEFKSEPFNIEMDRLWQAVQGINTQMERSVRLSKSSTATAPFLLDAQAGRALVWNGDGDGLISGPTADEIAAAQAAAEQAALYEGHWLDDLTELLADTALTYTSGQPGTVVEGDYVRTRKEQFSFTVAASGAGDNPIATAGGVKLYINSEGLIGVSSTVKRLQLVAGTLRNFGTVGSPDWQFIADSGHRTLGVSAVSVVGGKVRVTFDEAFGKVVSLVCGPDETMARAGFTCGPSVGTTIADIEIGQRVTGSVDMATGTVTPHSEFADAGKVTGSVDGTGVVSITHPSVSAMRGRTVSVKHPASPVRMPHVAIESVASTLTKLRPYVQLAGYAAYNGVSWALTTQAAGVSVADAGGVVTITHPAVNAGTPAIVSGRDNGAVIAMPDGFAGTTMTVRFRDFAGAAVAVPSTDWRFNFMRPEYVPAAQGVPGEIEFDLGYASVDASQTTLNLGNIWIVGIMESA